MTTIAAALHPSDRPMTTLPLRLLRHAALAVGAAMVVLAAGAAVRLALALLVTGPGSMPLLAPAILTPGTIVVDGQLSPVTTPAALDAAPAIASPAAGTTGTAELPPIPQAALDMPVGDATITPARPFSLAAASRQDRSRALECLTAAIYYESASEPDDGQRAVAQVVLNRVRHPVFPSTVCGVVYQGSERSGCQFSFACDGAMARVPSSSGWARAARNAAAALGGYVFAPVGLATHYHTYAVTPAWNRTLVMTDAIGAHFFHRWKGYWGTAAAFRQAYRGGEPYPGPHQRIAAPVLASGIAWNAPPQPIANAATAAAMPAGAPRAVTPQAQLQPAYRASGEPIGSRESDADSQVLDRWKDSGKPLK